MESEGGVVLAGPGRDETSSVGVEKGDEVIVPEEDVS